MQMMISNSSDRCDRLSTGLAQALAGALSLAALALLPGCAFNRIPQAAPTQPSGAQAVVVEGRLNHVIDGRLQAPYGRAGSGWPVPRFTAARLQDGSAWMSPEVSAADGGFRWALPPGDYLVTQIGIGQIWDDTLQTWPRVLLCVPPATGPQAVHVGHLRMEGTRYDETRTLSTGTSYRARGIRWLPRVVDEAGPGGGPRRLMQVRPDLPTGDALAQALQQDREGLLERSCGPLAPAPTVGTQSPG